MSETEIGDIVAEHIAKLSSLTSLNIDDYNLGDAGAKAIAKLTSLRNLEILRNKLGQEGKRVLRGKLYLFKIYINECT